MSLRECQNHRIVFKKETGDSFFLDIPLNINIQNVKLILLNKIGQLKPNQMLIFKTRILNDGDILEKVGIKDQSQIDIFTVRDGSIKIKLLRPLSEPLEVPFHHCDRVGKVKEFMEDELAISFEKFGLFYGKKELKSDFFLFLYLIGEGSKLEVRRSA